jgi:hypothetical protein
MPAETEKQAKAARVAYAAKTGKIPKSKVKGASKEMLKGMTKKELKKYTHTKESFEDHVNKILNKLIFN